MWGCGGVWGCGGGRVVNDERNGVVVMKSLIEGWSIGGKML